MEIINEKTNGQLYYTLMHFVYFIIIDDIHDGANLENMIELLFL